MKSWLTYELITGSWESPPSRGAWIEISMKSAWGNLLVVAPLAGGVD